MLAIQKVYKNGVQVNERKFEDNTAQLEFINCLILAHKKMYKCKITFDHIRRESKAIFYINHELYNGDTTTYKYEYLFYNITNNIEL